VRLRRCLRLILAATAAAPAVVLAGNAVQAQPSSSSSSPPGPSAPDGGDDPRELFGLEPRPAVETRCAEAPDPFRPLGGRSPAPREECALSQDPFDEHSPLVLGTWLEAQRLLRLPGADATHESQAAFVLGVGRDDAGVVIGGASSLENRWTVEGAPADSIRLGGSETRIPLPFLAGVRITTGGFSARDRTSSGGVIDAELLRGGERHVLRAYGWAGMQAQRRDRPVLPGTFTVIQGRITDPSFAAATVVASGPLPRLLGGRPWYAVGVAPSVTDLGFEQTGVRLVDRDRDDKIDRDASGGFVTEPISRHTNDATARVIPLMARLGLDRPEQSLELSLVGQWSGGARFQTVATPEATTIERDTLVLDGIATWRRRWNKTALRGQFAWHRSARDERAGTKGAGDVPQLQTAFVPTTPLDGIDPRITAACDDGLDDLYPGIPNCPVPTGWFSRLGVGLLADVTADRPSFSLDVTREVSRHVVRAGVLAEDARMVIDSRYSGGSLLRSLFEGHSETVQFVDRENLEICAVNIDVPCPTLDAVSLAYRTRNAAAYLEDTWRPRADLLIDFGLRWEYQQFGSRLKFSDGLAPRAGVAWDPLGRGRSRVAASFARLFTYLPAGLGELIDKTPVVVRNITFGTSQSRVIESAFLARVQPEVSAMTTDEAVFSAEVMWPRLGRLHLRSQHRWLREGLESTAEGFGNPRTASRRVDLLGVELSTSTFADLGLRVGYAWGQARGSLVGAYDPRRGNILYASSDYDEVTANSTGVLPSDLGHRFYAELSKQRRFGPVAIEGGARLSLASGRPRSLIGDSGLFGPIYLLPRGTGDRLPALLSTDLRVAARWRGTALSFQVQNLFNREAVTSTDETYASGLYSPIDGGSAADLVFLKDAVGTPARRALAYGTPTSYQLPIVVVLGIESRF
jgi:TonB dependent receptor